MLKKILPIFSNILAQVYLAPDVMQLMYEFLDAHPQIVKTIFAKYVILIVSGQRKVLAVSIRKDRDLFVDIVWIDTYSNGNWMMQNRKWR